MATSEKTEILRSINAEIPEHLHARMDDLRREIGVSKTGVITRGIELALEEFEPLRKARKARAKSNESAVREN